MHAGFSRIDGMKIYVKLPRLLCQLAFLVQVAPKLISVQAGAEAHEPWWLGVHTTKLFAMLKEL
jgi:hypothetical protein